MDFPYIASDVEFGQGVRVHDLVNLYGCVIGDGSRVGPFVEIQRGVRIGSRCKISSHSFICEGVTIDDEVFIGHMVCFTNDRLPRATNEDGELQGGDDWELLTTRVRRRASVGSGAIILPGVELGEESVVGAGAVVTQDVPARTIVAGNPARVIRRLDDPTTETT